MQLSSFACSFKYKYLIYQWHQLPACAVYLSIPCGQSNCQLCPINKKLTSNFQFLFNLMAKLHGTKMLRKGGMCQTSFSCFASKSKGNCVLLSLAISFETECMDQCTNPKIHGYSCYEPTIQQMKGLDNLQDDVWENHDF